MDNRGGTSIEELMRGGGQNSNMNDDDDVINSILSEINSDKEQQMKNSMAHQQAQQHQLQQIEHQKMMQQQQMQMERMKQEQMMQKQLEIERMREQSAKADSKENINICENTNLLDEFKSSIIFFTIFMLLNLTQINNLICNSLSIENNNIFILLKTFVATVIFFFINKLVYKYI